MRRVIVLGACAVALLVPLGGCGDTSDGNAGTFVSPAASDATASTKPRPAEPAALLADAHAQLKGKSLKYIVGDGEDQLSGGYDAASGGNTVTGEVDGLKVEIVSVRNDIYVDGLIGEGKWVHAQASKFKDYGIGFLTLVDPLFGQKLLSTATGIKQDGPGKFSGTVNLTKATLTGPAKKLVEHFVKLAGAKAKAVRFTATTSRSGALSTLDMTIPKVDVGGSDLEYSLKVSSVGGSVRVAVPPKKDLVEAPSEFYSGP